MRSSILAVVSALAISGWPLLALADWALADRSPEKPAGEKPDPDKKADRDAGRGEGRDDHESLHRKLEDESEANLKEIVRLMEKARDGLARKETGDPTQNEQREAVKKIQELIDKIGKG